MGGFPSYLAGGEGLGYESRFGGFGFGRDEGFGLGVR